jgi:recombination endonuclease VII
MSVPLREGLRPLAHGVGQKGEVPPSITPARPEERPTRLYCPNAGKPRPSWLPPRQFCCPHDHSMQGRYGITCDDWNRLLIFQRGRCAVCGGLEGKGRRFVVDHDHDPPYPITGLSHFGCNRTISQRIRRYLADPPGRALGLTVPARKVKVIEEKDRAKRARYRERHKPTKVTPVTGNAVSFGEKTEAALRATGGR